MSAFLYLFVEGLVNISYGLWHKTFVIVKVWVFIVKHLFKLVESVHEIVQFYLIAIN